MTCLKTPRPQTLQRNHPHRLVQDGALHQTMLIMTVVGMMTHPPAKGVDSVLQGLVPVEEHLEVDCQMETIILVEEEDVVDEAEAVSVTLIMMTTKVVAASAALEVALVVDLNHPMKMEMMIQVVEVSEVEGVVLEGTGAALTLQEITNQDLVTEEVVEGLETGEVDLIMIMKMKGNQVASAAEEVMEGLETDGEVLAHQMTMMKTLEVLVAEEVVVVEDLAAGGVDLIQWKTTKMMENPVALVAEGVVEGLETEEEVLVLQTIMTMKTLEALVAEEVVVVLEGAGEDLALAVMMETTAQIQVVALAQDEEVLVDSNHPMMETLVSVASDQLMMMIRKMTVSHVDEAAAEVGGDVVVSAVVVTMTMMMGISTQQSLVRLFINILY